jgi:hypothetical protein
MNEFAGALVFFGLPASISLAGLFLILRPQNSWRRRLVGGALACLGASVIWADAIMWHYGFECTDGDCGRWFSVASTVVAVAAAAVLAIALVGLIRWMFPRDGTRQT